MDLFTHTMHERMKSEAPWQAHAPAQSGRVCRAGSHRRAGQLLRRAIESDRLFSSIILWRPRARVKPRWRWSLPPDQEHFETLSRFWRLRLT